MSTHASSTFEPLIIINISNKCCSSWWIGEEKVVNPCNCKCLPGVVWFCLWYKIPFQCSDAYYDVRLMSKTIKYLLIRQSNTKVQLHKILHVCHCNTINIATFLARLRPLFLVVFWLDSHTFNTYIHLIS